MSLRAYLTRLAETRPPPAERADRAKEAKASLEPWNGYAPSASEEKELDGELDRRLAQASRR
nr:hypothetical protein [Streptomyces tsukubensis NRRL18488]